MVNKYDLSVLIRLFPGLLQLWKAVHFFRDLEVFQWIQLLNLIQDFQFRFTYWVLVEMLLRVLMYKYWYKEDVE
jgi:hypothetical protein